MTTSTPLLEIDGIAASYGLAVALRDVSIRVDRGSAVALLGANGAGKTTTIRAICGLLGLHSARVTDGRIRIKGDDVGRKRSDEIARLGVAHVPEGRLVFANLSVEENLRLGATARRSPGADDTMDRMLELFPILKRRLKDAGGYLSGGEQQMLAISRALMAAPDLLLLDEVSLGLAPLITRDIFATMGAVREEFGTSMLVVEQNANLALAFCDAAYVVENGSVTLGGDAEQLRSDTRIQDLYLGGGHSRVSGEAQATLEQTVVES